MFDTHTAASLHEKLIQLVQTSHTRIKIRCFIQAHFFWSMWWVDDFEQATASGWDPATAVKKHSLYKVLDSPFVISRKMCLLIYVVSY